MDMQKVNAQAAQPVEQKVLTLADLNDEEKKKVEQIQKELDLDNSQSIIQFGVGSQSGISNFSDTILNEIRSRDSGYVGNILTELMLKVKSLDVDSLSGESGLSKIPIIGSLVHSAKKSIAGFDKLAVQIEKIVDELTKSRMQLLKDITMFDSLYEKNIQYIRELDLYILAGKMKQKELEEKVIPELRAKADKTKDTLDAQKVQDMTQALNRLEKKVHDLQLSRMVALQTNPQVRLIQSGDQVLVEKIQSSILNTVPLWKNQVVIAIGVFRQKKALEAQSEVSKTTNELLQKNAEMLKQGTVEVAKESERGIVEMETLKKVHDNLIATIEETLRIQQEGKAKRQLAEGELVKLEGELKTKLKEAGARSPGLKLS
ncbi:MAG TPA: toxic anion resistance protein [Spirochaetota bacterium]|nr:toxic anion resistance protein [Spirochaetota bacterium]HPG49019.1 toxic anion resistance protein [Spirochaetota bacterium]HPN12346.1 toxic anion resistance protein [Spirochaetota bacterium]